MRVEITADAAGASGSGWPATTYLMSYQSIEDFLPLAKKHGAAHRERLLLFHSRGTLLMAGPLGDPINGDAIGLFTTRETAEEFVAGDPFVLNRMVARWTIRPWTGLIQG